MRAVVAKLGLGPDRRTHDDEGRRSHAWRHSRQGSTPNRDVAQLAHAFVGMVEMLDLVERERRLGEQQDGASQGDGPIRFCRILSRRL